MDILADETIAALIRRMRAWLDSGASPVEARDLVAREFRLRQIYEGESGESAYLDPENRFCAIVAQADTWNNVLHVAVG